MLGAVVVLMAIVVIDVVVEVTIPVEGTMACGRTRNCSFNPLVPAGWVVVGEPVVELRAMIVVAEVVVVGVARPFLGLNAVGPDDVTFRNAGAFDCEEKALAG